MIWINQLDKQESSCLLAIYNKLVCRHIALGSIAPFKGILWMCVRKFARLYLLPIIVV